MTGAANVLCIAAALTASTVFAVAGAPPLVEVKTTRHVVRIDSGPGEPRSHGSYAIRVYDADGAELVAGLVRPRDGELVNAWVTEANPPDTLRIWIWTRSVGSGSYGTLAWVTFDGKSFREAAPVSPDNSLLEGYMGHDRFDVVDGKIYRQFPIYGPRDTNADPTGGTRYLEFDSESGTWRLSNPRFQDN